MGDTEDSADISVVHADSQVDDSSAKSIDMHADIADITQSSVVRRSPRLAEIQKTNETVNLMTALTTFILDHQSVLDEINESIADVTIVDMNAFQIDYSKLNEFKSQLDSMYEQLQSVTDNKVDSTTMSMYSDYVSELEVTKQNLEKRMDSLGSQLQEDKELKEAEEAVEGMRRKLEEKRKMYEERKQSRKRTEPLTINSPAVQGPRIPTAANLGIAPVLSSARDKEHAALDSYTKATTVAKQSPAMDSSASSMVSGPDVTPIQELTDCLVRTMKSTKRSALEPSTFTGDPLEFQDWEIDFDCYVEAEGLTGKEPLRYLKKYVSGAAKECIKGYFMLNTEPAYKDARKQLRERYGKTSSIARAMRTKLENWPRIEPMDGKELLKYSDFLSQILSAMESVPKLKALDDTDEIDKIAKILPRWLKTKWVDHKKYVEKHKGREPTFSDYYHLITDQAETQCAPLLAPDKPTKKETQGKKRGKGEHTTLSTATSTTAKPAKHCSYCEKDNHDTAVCFKLIAMSYVDTIAFFKQKKLCFSCGLVGHMTSQCEVKAKCKKCKGDHPHCLHKTAQDWEETKEKVTASQTGEKKAEASKATEESKAEQKDDKQKIAHMTSRSSAELLNMVVPVYISADNTASEILAYAVLDNGSDSTYIAKDVAQRINPPSVTEEITVTTLSGHQTGYTNKYDITVRCFEGAPGNLKHQLQAYEQSSIPCNQAQIPTAKIAKSMPLFNDIANLLPPKLEAPIGLLIGRDFSHLLAPHETIIGKNSEPFAIKTTLGWTLCGGNAELENSQHTTCFTQTSEFNDLDDRRRVSQNDIKFIEILEDGMEQSEDGSITLPLPFKDVPFMPNNKSQAQRRLSQLVERFKKDSKLKEEYFQFMDEVIKSGHAEPVLEDSASENGAWYLPHFSVYHPKKQKLRVVFDASVKFKDKCLNEELLAGPDHVNNLVGILLRFRTKPIGISCDIEKMFHNFKVTKQHRDFLRFLWVDPDLSTVKEYRMTVHLFGATSSPGVATFALRKLATQASVDKSKASKFIIRDFYVDDGITSVSSVPEAIQLVQDATELCASANLRLHKFVSNSREVLQSFPTTEIVKEAQGLDLCKDKLPAERTLGMEWRTNDDCFTFSGSLQEKPNTKKGILSIISQIYDPLGLLSPFLLQGKMLMQRVHQETCDWKDEIPSNLAKDWQHWKDQLNGLQNVSIPRCLTPAEFLDAKRVELHHFSDASLEGYGACSYLRVVNREDKVHVALIIAKSRVAPLKSMTIPRLELQAAVEAVRLQSQLQSELNIKINAEYFWCDSTVTLGFINNSESKFHMFVANRVAEIRRSTSVTQWHHVPGSCNPADLVSRGCGLTTLISSDWWSGPKFLQQLDISENLTVGKDYNKFIADSVEVKKPRQALSTLTTTTTSLNETVEKFSSWNKLIRATATAKAMLQNKSFKKPAILVEDLQLAEDCIIKAEQKRLFAADIVQLEKKAQLPKRSKLLKLTPFLDTDGILRMQSRAITLLTHKERNPAILANSALATLLVRHYHEQTHHQGANAAISALRQAGFWITGVSSIANSLVRKCVLCKRNRANPMIQQMGALPKERTEQSPPFTHIGIDTFGPFLVKDRRTVLKRYGIIFSCLYSRSLHIEVADDLTTDSFLQALRRLQAIRGPVATIYSDGGTNFIGGRNQMEKDLLEVQNEELKRYLTLKKIKFHINTPTASHQGGVWERQIRIVRAVLNGMSVKYAERMTTEALRTAFYEIMATVNSVPLSADNLKATDVVITANHLLTLKSQYLPPPPGNFESAEVYGRTMYRKTQQMAEDFWMEWKAQYLKNIEARAKWEMPKANLKVGDIVLVADKNEPRNRWKTGTVTDAHQGADGLVRKATVMLGTSDIDNAGRPLQPRVALERPVQKLVKLMSAEN